MTRSAYRLSSYKGRPVALPFLYTNCADVFPLIAANLHEAYRKLGDQATRVGIVAVTVDPEHDSVETARDGFDVEIKRQVIPTDGSQERALDLKSHYEPAQTVIHVGTGGAPTGANVQGSR